MDNIELENQINHLLKDYDKEKNGLILDKIESLFESYLEDNPRHTEVMLQLAEFERSYFHDDYKAQDVLLKVLRYAPNNAYAALILSYLAFTLSNRYKEESLQILNGLQTDAPEILSMIEYVKSLYYAGFDREKYKECLKKSIKYYDKHVRNNYDLGLLYGKKTEEGKKLIKKAFDNVKLIYCYFPNTKYESKISTIDDFLNYFIKGTHLTEPIYSSIKESLDS